MSHLQGERRPLTAKFLLGAPQWSEQRSPNCFTTLSLISIIWKSWLDSFLPEFNGPSPRLIPRRRVRNSLRTPLNFPGRKVAWREKGFHLLIDVGGARQHCLP